MSPETLITSGGVILTNLEKYGYRLVSDRAMDVAPAEICPILNAPNTDAVAVDNDDQGAPSTIGK